MSIERNPKALKVGAAALTIEPLTVRIPVAVRLTGIGRSKLYELIKSGDVKTVKIGSATLVTMASLRRLVERGSS